MGRDRNRANLVDGGMVRHCVRMPGDASPIVRGSSGAAQDVVRGSIWCAGACAVISGVIVSPAGISGAAIGCVRSFVRWFWFWWWWMRRYALPICTTDMHRRYGATICKAGKQKRPRACCSWPLMLFAFVILYFCFRIHLSIFPISVGTIRERNSSN